VDAVAEELPELGVLQAAIGRDLEFQEMVLSRANLVSFVL
jgi:hypothetical protein